MARLLVNFTLSAGVFVGSYFLGSTFASIMLAAVAGYLLSCDVGSLGSQVGVSTILCLLCVFVSHLLREY